MANMLDSLDELIERLTPNVEPKYKVGDEVHYLSPISHYEIKAAVVISYCHNLDDGFLYELKSPEHERELEDLWQESQIFPTRQALIDHQIEYWQSLSENKPFIAQWKPLTDEQIKEWRKASSIMPLKPAREPDAQNCEQESEKPLSSCCFAHAGSTEECYKPQCEHEPLKYILWSQCKKCGELYR